MRVVPALAVLAIVVAAPVAAQQPAPRDTARHPMMGHPMQMPGMAGQRMAQGGMMHDSAMGEGMMRSMASEPEHLLGRKTELRLTADQERRITAIRDAARPGHDAAMRTAQTHLGELEQVMRAAAPDTAAVRMHFDAAHAAMGQAHLAMLEAAAQARAVLTDEQRRQVDAAPAGMRRGQAPARRR